MVRGGAAGSGYGDDVSTVLGCIHLCPLNPFRCPHHRFRGAVPYLCLHLNHISYVTRDVIYITGDKSKCFSLLF